MTDSTQGRGAPSGGLLLEVRGLDKSFGATQALVDARLEVRRGEIHALVGENGAGKSTMIKVLAGALHPDRGEIVFAGRPYKPTDPLHARASGISTCYQELAVVPHLNAVENILLGEEMARWGWVRWRESRRRVRELLESLEQSHIPLDVPAGRLPLASQQFIEIARAIASDARLVVLDEPTSALTQSDTECLFALVRRLRDQGIGFLYVSHFLEEVVNLCDRYTVMRDGRTVATGDVAEITIDGLIAQMVGRRIEDLYPRVAREIGEPLLTVTALTGVGARPNGAEFEVRRGEILGIGGLVGSGRSELLRTIFGLRRTSGGDVRMAMWPDEALAGRSPASLLRRGLGFSSEDRKTEGLALNQTLAENIGMAALRRAAPGGWLRPALLRRMAVESADTLSTVYRDIRQRAMDLSGGNQQKVALARLMFVQARVLLLDEPTRGIDVGSKAAIYRWLGEEAARGRAIVMTSSYIPELLGICDRIGVMYRGRLVALAPRDSWSEEKVLQAATTGVNAVKEN